MFVQFSSDPLINKIAAVNEATMTKPHNILSLIAIDVCKNPQPWRLVFEQKSSNECSIIVNCFNQCVLEL